MSTLGAIEAACKLMHDEVIKCAFQNIRRNHYILHNGIRRCNHQNNHKNCDTQHKFNTALSVVSMEH
jgi:hypothetical protein